MRSFVLLILIFCSVSCGPDFITKHGFHVYDSVGKTTPKEIEFVTDTVLDSLYNVFPTTYNKSKVIKILKNKSIEIHIESDKIDGKYYGVHNKDNIDLWHRSNCIASTTLWHEEIHLINYQVEGFNDPSHKRKEFFRNKDNSSEENQNSIESKAFWDMCNESECFDECFMDNFSGEI